MDNNYNNHRTTDRTIHTPGAETAPEALRASRSSSTQTQMQATAAQTITVRAAARRWQPGTERVL